MFCTGCGAEIHENETFCTNCGKRVDNNASAPQQANASAPTAVFVAQPQQTAKIYSVATGAPEVAQPAPTQDKSSNTQMIIVVILGVVAVAAIVFAIVMGTGAFNKDDSATDSTTVASSATSSNAASSNNSSSAATQSTPAPSTSSSTSSSGSTLPSSNPYSSLSSLSYVIPDSGSRYLSSSELSSYSAAQLIIARNEIFARHGRIFKDANLDAYFRSKSWYSPQISADTFDANLSAYMSQTEIKNAETILNYEKARNYATTL